MFRRVFSVIGRASYDLWDNLIVLVVANLIWSLFLIPALLIGLIPLPAPLNLIAVLLTFGLVAGPATIGLYNMTAEVRREERIEFGDFWRGMKQLWRRGLVLMLINAVVGIFAYLNLYFYTLPQFDNSPIKLLSIIWVYLLATWLIAQSYLWTLAVRTTEAFRLRLIFRNAFLATFKYPTFTLPIGLFLLVVLVLSVVLGILPLVFAGAIYHALISNRALSVILEQERERAASLDVDSDTNKT